MRGGGCRETPLPGCGSPAPMDLRTVRTVGAAARTWLLTQTRCTTCRRERKAVNSTSAGTGAGSRSRPGRLAPAAEDGLSWPFPNLWMWAAAGADTAAAANTGPVCGACALAPFRFSLSGRSPGLRHSQPIPASALCAARRNPFSCRPSWSCCSPGAPGRRRQPANIRSTVPRPSP